MARQKGSHTRSTGSPRKLMGLLLSWALIVLGTVALAASPAVATGNGGDNDDRCTYEWVRDVPQSHQEFKYEKTQWYFVKYTHTKTRTWVEGTPATPDQWWNWSPNNTREPQDYEPAFPTDPRGTWQGPHNNGGPEQDTYGTFQTGPAGNSNWFHRNQGTPGTDGHWGEWTDYGPWERWSPDTHTSWQDSNVEALGSPAFHASGTYQDGTQWYREWQARNTGETRQVAYMGGNWTTDTPGSPWVKVAEKTVQDAPIHQGPVRSASEPDRGEYPNVPWIKVPGSKECTQDNNWEYTVTCTAVSGTNPNYGDSVDSNVRIKNLITGEVRTFNYYGPDNGSGGVFSYEYADEYGVPSSWTSYEVQWVQVHTTNYHWEGNLVCGEGPEEPEYYLETSHQTTCGAITITLHNVSPWIYPVSYSIDGTTPNASGPNYGPVVDNRGTAPDDQTKSKTLTFTEDQGGGTVTVKYVVAAGTESDLYRDKPVGQVTTVVVDTDCEEPQPEPEGDLKVSSTCESISFSADGIKPEGAEVIFKLDDEQENPGTYPVTPGSHTVELWVNGKLVDSETVKVEKCPIPPQPEGNLKVSSTCESVTINVDGVKPEDAKVVVKEGEVVKPVNTPFAATPGSHTYDLYVNGVKVDSKTVTVKDCPTPPTQVTPAAYTVKPPTCDTDGSLFIPEQPAGVLVQPAPDTYGPGVYNVIYSAASGYVLTTTPSGTVTVLAATGYQDEDASQACYIEREPDVRTTTGERESCRLGGVEMTETVYTTTYSFDEETQEWESSEQASSSVSFVPYTKAELKALGCMKTPDNPDTPDNPAHPTNPPHAGGTSDGTDNGVLLGLGGLALIAAGLLSLNRRRVGERA